MDEKTTKTYENPNLLLTKIVFVTGIIVLVMIIQTVCMPPFTQLLFRSRTVLANFHLVSPSHWADVSKLQHLIYLFSPTGMVKHQH